MTDNVAVRIFYSKIYCATMESHNSESFLLNSYVSSLQIHDCIANNHLQIRQKIAKSANLYFNALMLTISLISSSLKTKAQLIQKSSI